MKTHVEIFEANPIAKSTEIIGSGGGGNGKSSLNQKATDFQTQKVLGNIKESKSARESSNFKQFSERTTQKYFEKIDNHNFFKNAKYTEKVRKQASSGDYHAFPQSVDGFAQKYGKTSIITGGDGIPRIKLELKGEYKGKKGVFEYIRNPNGTINHRLFVPKE